MYQPNQKQKEYLKRTAKRHKLTQAYIFSGPDETGKMELALYLIKLVNQPKEKNWRKVILKKQNPDIFFIGPQLMKEKSKNVTIKTKDISIKDLKKGLEKSNYYNYKNKCKFIFIEKAEKLSSTAANSLLKLIEETKEDTRIILLTNNEELVLPTIRSRCQIIRTETMGDDSMENYLREKYIDQSNEAIKQAVKLSAGRFKLAEKYLTDLQLMKRIGWWQDQFLQVLDKKGVEGLILAEELARTKEDKLLIMDSWISLMERYLKERIKAKKEKSAVDKLKFNLNDLIELKNYLTTTNSNQKLQWENFFVQLSN